MKTALLLLTGLIVTACSSVPTTTVTENKPKPQATATLDKQVQQGAMTNYLCKDDQEIRVVRIINKSKKAKSKDVINLTFKNVTRRLVLAISESGKKYTNIRWHWHEKTEFSVLTNSLGEVLAEQCVPQS
ncbi:MAG TPA: opacity-associated protein OapB [Pasteurellaceae bacterium]|nr:opacity-associated protein OapB [Pasteurellaceae bacterium]